MKDLEAVVPDLLLPSWEGSSKSGTTASKSFTIGGLNTSRYWFWWIPVPEKVILLLVQKQNVSLLQARCTQDGETTVACRRLGELFAGNKI